MQPSLPDEVPSDRSRRPPPAQDRPAWDAAWADPRLRVIAACLLLYFHMTFLHWRERPEGLSTGGVASFNWVPAPVLQDLTGWVFLDSFQVQAWLYLQGLAALGGLLALLVPGGGRAVLPLLGWLWVNKLYFYLADFRLWTNYHHFHLLYTLVFLVAGDRLRLLRAALGVSYLLSGLVKLTPSWLHGEYFKALPDRLPLLPKADWAVTAACVAVIVLEFLGPLAWFLRTRWIRGLSFGAFLVFHAYSGVIVGLWYTSLMLPLVAAAFAGFREPLHAAWPRGIRNHAALGILGLALAGGLVPLVIPGDARLTGEGRHLGVFMFDANHSVRFQAVIRKGERTWVFQVFRRWQEDGESGRGTRPPDLEMRAGLYRPGQPAEVFEVTGPVTEDGEVLFNPALFTLARMRLSGDPYLYHHYAREVLRRHRPDQLSIRLDERLDGHPESVTLVDIGDFGPGHARYRLFRRNEWIRLPGTDAPDSYRWP